MPRGVIKKKKVVSKRTAVKRKVATKKVVAKKKVVSKKKLSAVKQTKRPVAKKKTIASATKKKAAVKKTAARRASAAKAKKPVAKKTKAQIKKEEEMRQLLERARAEKKLYQDIPSKYRPRIKKLVEQCKSLGYTTSDVLEEHIKLDECDDTRNTWVCIQKILEHNCIDHVENNGWLQEFQNEKDVRFPDFEQMPYDSVQLYLKDIGKYDLLSASEEQELAKQIFNRNALIDSFAKRLKSKNGLVVTKEIRDEADRKEVLAAYLKRYKKTLTQKEQTMLTAGAAARDTLATANLRLVAHIAKTYTNRSRDLNLLDLVQEGADGLYKAVDGFDYRKGYKFSTYATWWIRQSVNRGLLDKSKTIRIPVHMHETIQRYHTVNVRLEQDLGRPPTVEEIATELDETVDKIYTIRRAIQNVVKLDRPIGRGDEGGDTTIAESHTDDEQETPAMVASQEILREQIQGILKDLSVRERQVIELRHGMHDGVQYTLEQIGKKLGVTRERVRQIECKALEKLRSHATRQKLESYK